MKETLMQRFLVALRSGDYMQDTGYLRTENGYCCFGVLCEIADVSFEPSAEMPSNSVLFRVGLPVLYKKLSGQTHTEWSYDQRVIKLAEMNDGGINFRAIADYIEEHYT